MTTDRHNEDRPDSDYLKPPTEAQALPVESAARTTMQRRNGIPSQNIPNIPAMMYSWQLNHSTGESHYVYVSDYCQELFGISSEQALHDDNLIANTVVEDDSQSAVFATALHKSRHDLSVLDKQVQIRRATDGALKVLHFVSRPRREETSAGEWMTIWDGVVTDVTKYASLTTHTHHVTATTGKNAKIINRQPLNQEEDSPKNQQAEPSCVQPLQPHPQSCQSEGESLQQQRDAAVKLVHAERGLTEWLSHEVRNPLSVAMEALQTLQELNASGTCCTMNSSSNKSPSHRRDHSIGAGFSAVECQKVMLESITYVTELLNNMMDLDQVAQGQMPVVSAPCQILDDILLPTYRMMKRLRPDDPVKLRLGPSVLGGAFVRRDPETEVEAAVNNEDCMDISQGDCSLDGLTDKLDDVVANVDKLRLKQILNNLIANGFHFTTKGFVEIDLRIHHQTHTGTEAYDATTQPAQQILTFHVRDSGCGVKPCQYDTLFSRWEQLGTSRNGTGIGLCLCQALVRAMGGTIRLNTKYHSGVNGHPGAEFIVELPLEPTMPVSTATSRTESTSTSAESLEKMSVAYFDPITPSSSYSSRIPLIGQANPSLPVPSSASAREPTPLFARNYSQGSNAPPPTVDSLSTSEAAAVSGRNSGSRRSSASAKSYFPGRYRFLIVDDEKIGRKFLKRRFSRLFPEAIVSEVASGEEALVESSKAIYDVITMDHFMAVDELNGDETIRELRKRNKDALIVGISGNDKRAEHVQAGADSFFRKPLPNDTTLIESLQHQLAPPVGWKVLILSDDSDVATLLTSTLQRVSSPHYTTREEAAKRWKIVSRSLSSTECKTELFEGESFDLVIWDNSKMEPDSTHYHVRQYLRDLAATGDFILVECSRNDSDRGEGIEDVDMHQKSVRPVWNISALPTVTEIRQSLCRSLLTVRRSDSSSDSSAGSSSKIECSTRPCPTRALPKRSNSGAAVTA